jgi:hypothetical protein
VLGVVYVTVSWEWNICTFVAVDECCQKSHAPHVVHSQTDRKSAAKVDIP